MGKQIKGYDFTTFKGVRAKTSGLAIGTDHSAVILAIMGTTMVDFAGVTGFVKGLVETTTVANEQIIAGLLPGDHIIATLGAKTAAGSSVWITNAFCPAAGSLTVIYTAATAATAGRYTVNYLVLR